MRLLTTLSFILLAFTLSFAQEDEEGEEEAAPIEMIWRCNSTLSYTWEKKVSRKSAEEHKENVRSITREASTEEEAKRELVLELAKVEPEILSMCRLAHESVANCVSSGIKKVGKDYGRWDFTARKVFIDSLTEDCQDQKGQCKSVASTEPVCESFVAPVVKEAEESEE